MKDHVQPSGAPPIRAAAGRPVRPAASNGAFADNRPAAAMQRRLQEAARQSAAPATGEAVIQRMISRQDLLDKIDLFTANINRALDTYDEIPPDIDERLNGLAAIATEFEESAGGKYATRLDLITLFADGLVDKKSDEELIKAAVALFRKKAEPVPEKYRYLLRLYTEEEVGIFKEHIRKMREGKGQEETAGALSSQGEKMPGLFGNVRWVGSGPDAENAFLPQEDKGDKGTNDFARWINSMILEKEGAGKLAPDPQKKGYQMNCWEGVMYTAFQAGLVDERWLIDVHLRAAKTGSGDGYFASLGASLGFDNTVPYDPESGLLPAPGDIVFFDKMEHVALALGGQKLMHLWHSTEGRKPGFEITSFEALFLSRSDLRTKTRFAPAPFRKK